MLQKTAEYALRAAVWLAQEPQKAHASERIAEAICVPRRYIHKVLQALARAEIVRSQPGPSGGYSLRRPAEQTTILDVVKAIGPLQRIRACPWDSNRIRTSARCTANWMTPLRQSNERLPA